jgi:hypothetical protein
MKTYWGSECIAPRILDLSTWWRWAASFTSLFMQELEAWMATGNGLDTWSEREVRNTELLHFVPNEGGMNMRESILEMTAKSQVKIMKQGRAF